MYRVLDAGGAKISSPPPSLFLACLRRAGAGTGGGEQRKCVQRHRVE